MTKLFKQLAALCILAAGLFFAPVSQTPAQALGAGLQASAETASSVTQVHYRRYRHCHRHYCHGRYYRHYRHYRRHRGVRIRIYI